MDSVRVDKWLWAARFFKTRSLAQAAVRGGHVEINGQGCKPARSVVVGDRLRVTRGEVSFDLEVLELSDRRGPAPVARSLYQETEASRLRREARAEARRLGAQVDGGRRPDKRDRRRIRQFSGKH